jgi:H+/Cl- antiporter ClcA
MYFQDSNFKRALTNFIQLLVLGYFAVLVVLSTIIVSSGAMDKVVAEILENPTMLLSPLLWFIPFLIALPIALIRGVVYPDFDPSNPGNIDRFIEAGKFRNQPRWFRVTVFVIVGLLVLGFFIAEDWRYDCLSLYPWCV